MRKILVLTFLFSILLTGVFAQYEDYGDYVIINKYNEAAQVAEFTGRPLMMLFSMATCKDCEEFKEEILLNEQVIEFLKERFVMVDVQPYPHLRGNFPLNTDSTEDFSYSELFRKYGIKRTPTVIFLDRNFKYVNRTTGSYTSEFFVETVKAFHKTFDYAALNDLRLVTEEMAVLLLETLKNSRLLEFEEFEMLYDSLDPLDYYIVEKGSFHDVQDLLQQKGNTLKNVYVFEGDLDYVAPEAEEAGEDTEPVEGNWTNINKEQVKEVLADNLENEEFYIIDVRTFDEYHDGNLENSINIDFLSNDFKEKISEYDKKAIYLVMCQSGGRSLRAVKIMEELGFEYIYHYEGGYSDWKN